MKKILVVFAHPALQKSRVNKVLIEGIKQIEGLTLHDLYEVYPDMDIDVEREQKLLEAHDVIIFQYPFFWYSSPALLKEYIDIVFQHDWAYGRKGNALKDRLFMVATTTGGNKQTYCPEGSNNFSIKQLLAPLEQTATLCKMKYLPPFVVHGTHSITPEEIQEHKIIYFKLLTELRDNITDNSIFSQFECINNYYGQYE